MNKAEFLLDSMPENIFSSFQNKIFPLNLLANRFANFPVFAIYSFPV